jgi:glycerophosphoryl diester phosphodiesterase
VIAGREVAKAKRGEFPDHTTLDEVLNRYLGRAFLDIELKVAGLEDRAADLLRKHDLSKGFVISSFLPEVLSALHRCDHNSPLGLICETAKQMEDGHRLRLTHLIPHYKLITPALIAECHAAQKQVFAWTVNSEKKMLELQDWGVDAIISDDTQLLMATIGGNQDPRS